MVSSALDVLSIFLPFIANVFRLISRRQGSIAHENKHPQIITNIRSLLNQTIVEYHKKNFNGASALVKEAYFDNYEFIEDPLSEQNETLMEETELMQREQLRDLVNKDGQELDFQILAEKINSNLDKAYLFLANQTTKN